LSHTCIAILGDLHGHITLAYRLLKRWEIEHSRVFSAIFQVGDFGAYPPPFRADKATMRFYEKDPDELSFVDYHLGSEEADEILGMNALPDRRISADMFFIKGNHEDFDYQVSIRKLFCIPDVETAGFQFGNEQFFLLARKSSNYEEAYINTLTNNCED
jgi:predicted phosphodiesterase